MGEQEKTKLFYRRWPCSPELFKGHDGIFLPSLGLFLLLLLASCKGPQGDKGDTGIQGLRGPGRIEVLNGTVISNDFTVTDSRIGQAVNISVYIGDNSALAESPYFLPTLGINTYWLKKNTNQIQIVNAVSAAATRYVIVLVIE